MKMPSKKQYNLVQNDDYDSRIPLHPEEAFHHGIIFHVKYIGTLDVPRPTNRVEIVAAMRRIRYEFKAKGVKKKKITMEISVDGVKVMLRKKKKKKEWLDGGPSRLVLFSHAIYRIFYVSHDSQDMKIFSYIARDAATNVFKCYVFKANKKSQAMRVVRTVGQAFEVCHKLSIEETSSPEQKRTHNENNNEDELNKCNTDVSVNSDQRSDKNSNENNVNKRDLLSEPIINEKLIDTSENAHQKSPRTERLQSPLNSTQKLSVNSTSDLYNSPFIEPLKSQNIPVLSQSQTESGSSSQEVQLLREQLEQQTRQTQAALAQVQMLQDQLTAERAARLEAQTRTHQLLVHNRELLDHITALISHLEDTDRTTGQVVAEPSSHPSGHLMCVSQLSSHAKVQRWFDMIPALSRQESGFVSSAEIETTNDFFTEENITDGTRSFLRKIKRYNRKKLLRLNIAKLMTF